VTDARSGTRKGTNVTVDSCEAGASIGRQMRTSNRGLRAAVAVAAVTAALAGCGPSSPPSPPPAAAATPLITPDPHLTAPASVDAVFRWMGSHGIRITPNTASGGTNGEPVKVISATYDDWPLVLTQFTTADALRRVAKFDPKTRPQRGEAPYILAGMNILVEFGPQSTNDATPTKADPARRAALEALVATLDPLLGPLSQRSIDPITLPHVTAVPSAPAPSSSAPAAATGSKAP
jgi:hypothetical protein